MWERPPPRSHRTGLYHQLFSLMGQGRMLLSICLSMAFSLISCPWPPLGSPHHTHLLHLWSLHLSTSFSLFSWLCVYLERNLWHVTILFSCNAICFGRNGGEWRGDDLTTTTTTTYRSSFVFQQMCIGHRLGHGERGLQSPFTNQMPGYFTCRRFLKTSPLRHNRWSVKIL